MTKTTLTRNTSMAVSLLTLALCVWVTAASATERGVAAHYQLYMGGFHVAQADIHVGLRADCFDVRLAAEPGGFGLLLTSFKIESRAGGCRDGEEVIPASYRSDYYKNGKKKRWVRVRYDGSGPSDVKAKPEAEEDDRDEVPAEMRGGSLDPISTAFGVLEAVTRDNRCSGDRPVYDGRRLFRLRLTHVGEVTLSASPYSAYAGPAIECLVRIDMVAGFKKNEIRKRHFPEQVRVFLAEAVTGAPMLPVRLEADYRLGQLRAHAVTIRPHPQDLRESTLR